MKFYYVTTIFDLNTSTQIYFVYLFFLNERNLAFDDTFKMCCCALC